MQPRREARFRLTLTAFFALAVQLVLPAAGVRAAPIAPPLPDSLSSDAELIPYYPDGSRRAKEIGRVVVTLTIDPATRRPKHPVAIDRALTDAPPRLVEAADKLLWGQQFDVGPRYRTTVAISLIFELEPCGNLKHARADYKISLCLDSGPFAYAYPNADRIPWSDLERAVRAVLDHNDLADIDFLERTLSTHFLASLPARAPSGGIDIMPDALPEWIVAQGFRYRDSDGFVRLEFSPRGAADLPLWGKHWKMKADQSEWTHGWGSSVGLVDTREASVKLHLESPAYGRTKLVMEQRATKPPYSSQGNDKPLEASNLLLALGSFVRKGDLRDVETFQTAFNVHLDSRQSTHYSTEFDLDSLVPGVDPSSFSYRINESGMDYDDNGISAGPAHPAERIVDLALTLTGHFCLTSSELEKQIPPHRTSSDRRNGWLTFSWKGENRIELSAHSYQNCVQSIDLHQVTLAPTR